MDIGRTGVAMNLPFLPLSGRLRWINDLSLDRVASAVNREWKSVGEGARVLWLQHPDYIAIASKLEHDLLVYDAMDPFEAFSRTSPWVVARERELLQRADLVFTGGRSLHREREKFNPNTHCFPSGVDFPHFAGGAEAGEIPADLREIGKPVLGYIGAIDERIDWGLIETLCRERSGWNIVMVGPLVGMNALPLRFPNLHYLGAKRYDDLPEYLRGFDVALIPWHVNRLTQYMSPTKTPEYLAAGRPVVSTAIPDVMADYANEVFIADNAGEFVMRCEQALERGIGPARKPPQARTWDETARAMLALMEQALAAKNLN